MVWHALPERIVQAVAVLMMNSRLLRRRDRWKELRNGAVFTICEAAVRDIIVFLEHPEVAWREWIREQKRDSCV